MKLTLEQFRAWENKSITLLGMSGVGKTHLATTLRRYNWFHYSGDYRIGTHYLNEDILDLIKQQAMKVPFLRGLLRKDWIYIRNNIKVDDLGPILCFVGKLGNPELGGVPLKEFKHRQALYREAEIAAMRDVPSFIQKSLTIYGYQHFINDVGGSLCDIESPEVIELLDRHSLILYIQASDQRQEELLVERAVEDPKPLYFRPAFLDQQRAIYLRENSLDYAAEMDPDAFTRWVFPRLFRSRIPRYEAITEPLGYSVSSQEVEQVRDDQDFIELLERAITRDGQTG
ncbi:MAG: ATPase [Candidatus Sedimenticola endophacoides]